MMKKYNLKANGWQQYMQSGEQGVFKLSTLNDFYEDIYDDIEMRLKERAKRLQARRWRALRRETI